MTTATIAYVHVPHIPAHQALAERFVATMTASPGGHPCRTLIVSQGTPPAPEAAALFARLPECQVIVHDNTGWDIGGFLAAARLTRDDMLVCLGSSAHVRRPGWLARMVEAWQRHGAGLYGSLSSYEVRPHLNTSGFWCAPDMLLGYPRAVRSLEERYEFEHGAGALWRRARRHGVPVKLVTWCGEYDWRDWRTPPDISCRGTQANCLTLFRLNDEYEHCRLHDPAGRLDIEARVDGREDRRWARARHLERAGSLARAAQHYVQLARSQDRAGVLAAYRAASLFERLGRLDAADAGFRAVAGRADAPADWRAGAAFHRATLARARGDDRQAIAFLEAALDISPHHGMARDALAVLRSSATSTAR